MAKYQGNAVVYGSPGVVACGASTFTNDALDGSASDASEDVKFKDGNGKTTTIIQPEIIKEARFTLRPGSGSASTGRTAMLSNWISKGDKVITSSFQPSWLNDTWRVEDVSQNLRSEDAGTVAVTLRKYEQDFSAGWQTLS